MDENQLHKITGLFEEMKTGYAKLTADIAQYGTGNGETKEKLAKQQEDLVSIKAEIQKANAEQQKANEERNAFAGSVNERLSALSAGKQMDQKSLGELVVENPDFISAVKGGGRVRWASQFKGSIQQFERKDITGVSLNVPQAYTSIIAGVPILPYGVRRLVPQGRTTAGSVEYVKETGYTNNAALVPEGTAKPKSDKVFSSVNVPVSTIAHYFKISKQTFDDLPALASLINTQGVQMLKYKEDNYLLNGNASPVFTGFMTVAAAAPAGASGDGLVDTLGLAVFDLWAKGFAPDGAVINPADWGAVAMTKNSQGNYLFVNPLSYTINNQLWGVQLVMSSNMTAGSYLVGAFTGNSLILDREEVNVQVATQNEDDFIKNMYTILIEERLALLIFQNAAFEKGALVP